MFSIGNDELDTLPEIDMAEKIPCPRCGKELLPELGNSVDGAVVTLAFVSCDGCNDEWLVGINGKKLEWNGEEETTMTEHEQDDEEEKVIIVEIFYKRNGVDFIDYSIECPEKLESRNLAWLLSCMSYYMMKELEELDL